MASAKLFLKSGHPPTLLAAFLYFDFSFAVWVLNGAMGPFISDAFKLSAAQTGLMVSVPTLAGAFMRFPLGILSQYIGRKNAAITEMSMILLAMAYGYFFVRTFNEVLAMGVLLGIAGASFGVALSLGSGWFPKQYKGLAMGIAGAGNSGTVLATLFAPLLATRYGWHQVYGFAGLMMLLPLLTMIIFAKEPPDREHQSLKEHISCLWEKDGWTFNLIYIITFGGFIGLSTFLPSFFYAQFHVTKIQAGQLTTLAAIMGSGVRILGGYLADKLGGILTLSIVLLFAIAALLACSTQPSLAITTLLFMLCFSALGAGNGALFQLVPLRWPLNTAVAGSMIGEIGALGGAILPNAMGLSKTYTGSFATGFITYSLLAATVLIALRIAQKHWIGKWIAKDGKVISTSSEVGLDVRSLSTAAGGTA
jgi:NNP family nitrate/nitrite transporter-like MFS transporter